MSVTHHDEYVQDLLGRLQSDLADAAEVSLTGLNIDQLNSWLLAMTGFVSQVQGLQAIAMQEADAAGLAPLFGSRVLTTHLAKATGAPAKALAHDRAVAVWLRDFPLFQQAFTGGVLCRNHVLALKEIDSVKIHELLIRDQQMIVDAVSTLDWVEWGEYVAYWLNAANPDGELSDPNDPAYGMTVRTKANGDVTVTILMDPITGEAFLTTHDAEVEKLSKAEREDPNAVPVSSRQKNLTAFMKLLIRGWKREDGTPPVPLINIVMSEQVAEDLLARSFGHETPDGRPPLDLDPFELPISWDDLDGRCETIRGTPVHPKHALGLLLIGKLRRTVMSAESRVIDLGHDVRFFNAA
ncbi:MAG: hypothetical protein ACR2PK_16000, partial [Acidimicrobiales bacterium]